MSPLASIRELELKIGREYAELKREGRKGAVSYAKMKAAAKRDEEENKRAVVINFVNFD